MTELSMTSLSSLDVPVPTYDRSGQTVGIVHLGFGGFHRAHQAFYVDELMAQGGADDWAICGVGLLPGDKRVNEVMRAQDCLYTVVLKHADGTWEPRVVGSVAEHLFAPDDPEAVLSRMVDPAVRIVSLTITEGGYEQDPDTGDFAPTSEAVLADLDGGAAPRSAFGFVVEALRRRRDAGVEPFTVLSCDNVQANGAVARRTFVAFARRLDDGLGAWIEEHVVFPNCMVDRITPMTTDEDRAEVARRFGVDDGWPVLAEPFGQWVVEDEFPTGRPALEKVGVQLVPDVHPYELMKLRLLNAGHQVLAQAGVLAGHTYVHEAAQDPVLGPCLLDYMREEALAVVPDVPGIDLHEYTQTLLERFANAELADTLARVCAYSSDRVGTFLLPVVVERGAEATPRAVTTVAAWALVCERGGEMVDLRETRLREAASRLGEDPVGFLRAADVPGGLADDDAFVAGYLAALDTIRTDGIEAAVRRAQLGQD